MREIDNFEAVGTVVRIILKRIVKK